MEVTSQKRILTISLILNIGLLIWAISSNSTIYLRELKTQNKELEKENNRLGVFVDSLKYEKAKDITLIKSLKDNVVKAKLSNDSLSLRLTNRKKIYVNVKKTRYTNISDSTLLRRLSKIKFDPDSL